MVEALVARGRAYGGNRLRGPSKHPHEFLVDFYALAVPITTAIVSRINRREGEIREAGKTMLLLAKEQGEDLKILRDVVRHNKQDGFREVIEQETRIVAIIRTPKSPRKTRPTLTREDAEYGLKINALAERGATDGERDAAAGKYSECLTRNCLT
jgi:uncharacterized protein (UPF0335 family)